METKSIVIFGMGMIVGYLLTNYMTSMQSGVMTPPVANPDGTTPGQSLNDYCEDEWMKIAMVSKFSSEEGAAAEKLAFMKDCLNRDGMPRVS